MDRWEEEIELMKQIDLVAPQIYISGADGAENKDELLEKGVTHVISIMCHDDPISIDKVFTHHIYHANDDHDTDIIAIAKQVHPLIQQTKSKGGCVLVNCGAGISRSVSVVIYHLMLENQSSVDDTLKSIQESRKIAFPNQTFMKQLRPCRIGLIVEHNMDTIYNPLNDLFNVERNTI